MHMSLDRGGGNSHVTWRMYLSIYSLLCISSHDKLSFSGHTIHRCVSMGLQQRKPLSNFHVTLQFGSSPWCLVCWVEDEETRYDIALDKQKTTEYGS